MNPLRCDGLRLFLIYGLLSVVAVQPLSAQAVDPEEAKEKSIVDRFVTVLEKNARRGTALDKVYGYHVERGSLDELIKGYRDKADKRKASESGTAWMIIGLLESLRGQDAVAVDAFEKGEKLVPDNYLASYYLGLSQVLVGQPDKAAEALERAIQRKPAQADLLDIYQALGRVYQRAQKTDKALEVWNRLEKQFPNDARVQEQIATTLLEEGEFAAALPRYQSLAKTTKDKYRQSLFQMEAAEIKVRMGQSDEAIAEFEKLLGQLNPDNWLYREVRRRIEAVYLRTDDQAGLIAYYETWIKKNAEDLEAVSRLSRLLAGLGRGPEAQAWLEKGLKVAPRKKELRNALIGQLVYEQKYTEAIAQYEQLDKYEPNNPDTLRDWGRLVLKDATREESARQRDAAAIWKRLTTAKPKDPLVASQVGELFRQAEMTDEALELYQKAIALAPEQAQYREYLGEYYHSLKRKDEALATWRAIAEGKLKTAPNVARLAEVLASFGYLSEAVETNAEACKLDPKDFSLQIKQADLLAQADQHDKALAQLDTVKKLAANDEEREAWLIRELRELQALDKLKERIAEKVKESESKDADHWFWLARAYESERQLKEAGQAVSQASTLSPQSVPILMASARIYEAQNNLLAAVEINAKLAAIDRRYRTEYLKQVATLEQKLGRRDKAVQAGRDLIAAAPGNPESYEFFSQLCFQLGETEEGLSALRRSVRVNPTEPKGLLLLASALSEQFRTGEAIELYWRAFDKAGNLDDRLGVVPKLTELYLQTNQLDRLLERLERQRREPNQQREMTICLAQAYQSAGDDGNARQELEKLLTEDTRDIQLLTQLVKLCETDGDLEAAVKFQQQLMKSAPGKESTLRLAQLLMKSGETDEATALMSRVTLDEKDPETVLKSLDSLLNQQNYSQARSIAEKLTRDQPKNWELLYREGVALAKSEDKSAEAQSRFEAILALNLNDDEMTLSAKNQLKKSQGRTRSPNLSMLSTNPLMMRSQNTWQIRQAIGLDDQNYYGGLQQPFWTPSDYGTARMACFGWLQWLARNNGNEDEFLKERREAGENAESQRELIDTYYLAAISNNSKETYNVLKKMSMRPGADVNIKTMYLSSLAGRGIEPGQEEAVVEVAADETSKDEATSEEENQQAMQHLAPLGNDEMEHVMACYREIDDTTLMMNFGESSLQIIAMELKRSGRKDEAEKLLKDAITNAKAPIQIASLLPDVVNRNDYQTALVLLDRLAELNVDTGANPTQNSNFGNNYAQTLLTTEYQSQILAQLMSKRAQKKAMSDVLGLWDRYLTAAVAQHEKQKSANAATKKRTQQNQVQQRGYVYIWRGNNQQYENLDFPLPNEYYDQSTIQMLRQAYITHKDAEISQELVEHFQKKLADPQTPDAQKVFWQFGLGYLHWWLDEKDEALSVLVAATEKIPDNVEMKFELAHLYERRGEHDQALGIVDSLAPTDQQMLQKREITALRMAVNSGNIDRARTAAERLFGLRLDSNLQIQLAQQMHQLGMHEQAEAVLSRAGRQAGNKTDVLSNLMQQYQSQGKNDVATQIAHQLLRRSGNRSTAGGPGRNGNQRGNDGTRQQALIVLNRSGKLPEMIKKIEDQLKTSPKSQRLTETLIEYYTASGDTKKAEELTAKIAESKQSDPAFQYTLAQQLMNQGKHNEAIEHLKVVIKKDLRLVRNNFWQIFNSFQSADKVEDFASLLDDIDLKSFRQNPWELTNIISNMSYQEKSKDRAMQLFKRAWKDLPDQRQMLLSNLNNESFWQLPEIYDYARQGIIPTETTIQQNEGWHGFGQIQSWGGDGKITTLMNRFLTIAATNKKLDELKKEVEETQKKLRKWDGGTALLALIDLRRGKVDEAKVVLEKLLPKFKGVQQGQYTKWEIGQELMGHDQCTDLAILYFEDACKDPEVMSQNGFQYTPGKPLVTLYKQRGRKEDARKVMVEASKFKSSRYNGNEDYEAYMRINNSTALGNEMKAMGYPVDALRVFQEQLARTEDFTRATRIWGGNSGKSQIERMKKNLETGFQAALKELKPELLAELLSKPIVGEKDNPPSIDMLLLIETRELDKTRLSSVLTNLVAGLASKPELAKKSKAALADLRSRNPNDLSAMILTALLAATANEPEHLATSVRQIVEFINRTPLESQPEKGSFTQKQRDAAMQQVAIWIVARECLKDETLRDLGSQLGERALEAARRQSDRGYALAILREWGQIAINAGDKNTASQKWNQMLEIVVPKPVEKPKKPEEAKTSSIDRLPGAKVFTKDFGGGRFSSKWEFMLAPAMMGQLGRLSGAGAVSLPLLATQAPPAPASKTNVLTLEQFEKAVQIAKMAAENGLKDLSIRAMTVALQAGPPVESIQSIDLSQPFTGAQRGNENDLSHLTMKIEEQLTTIERLWKQKGISDENIYNLLKTAVLPDRRPFEVFLYPRPLNLNPNQPPQSVGSLLVKAAISVNKVDEIREMIEPRLKQPLGELSGRVLLAQLALATQNNRLAAEQIELLSTRLKQDSLQTSSELVCHVAVPALGLPELPAAAMVLLERAVEHFSQNAQQMRGNLQEEPMRTFRFTLARLHFQNKNPAAGKKHLEEYLNFITFMYSRYGGDYAQQHRRIELMKVAAEYARAGQQTDVLDSLGRYADLPVSNNNGNDGPSRAGATILSGLASIPLGERYELLKQWSLPTDERKSIRVIANLIPGDSAPASFDALRGDTPRGPRRVEVSSTAELLVSAAAEANRLEDLQAAVAPYAEQDVEQAKFLLLLTKIARGAGDDVLPDLQTYLSDWKDRVVKDTNHARRAQISDLILSKAAMSKPELQSIGREMAQQFIHHASRGQEQLLMTVGRREYYASMIGDEIAGRLNQQPWNPDLLHWTAGAVVSARTEAGGAIPMWWVGQGDLIEHLCGPDASHLYLKYPLKGEFEVTCDAWLGGWGECDLGYGGIVFNALNLGSETQITSVGNRSDTLRSPDPPEVRDRYNRIRLEFRSDKVRYFINQTLIHEEPQPSRASPWLFIHCDKVWLTAMRNFQITGNPEIAKEVSLVEGNQLLGWVSEFYNESQPVRASNQDGEDDLGTPNSHKDTTYDWWAQEGVLRGRHRPLSGLGKTTVEQSRLYYDRPIQTGERLRYEFFYDTGAAGSHVAPALDRLAFLLEPDGVKLHWMTDGSRSEDAYGGLTTDNMVTEPAIQRGKLALKQGDWNVVEIALNDDLVTITLNQTVIAERKLEAENSRQFGFYHDKNATSVQVRNVVLTGDWPQSLSPAIESNLFAASKPRTPAERSAYGRFIDEKFYATDLEPLLRVTRAMPPEAQYEKLKNWVLPNDDHAGFRLYADFTADYQLPGSNDLTARIDSKTTDAKPSRRQKSGGELFSPALDLIDVAKSLNRLQELESLVKGAAESTPVAARSRKSMQVMIAAAKGEFDKSRENLQQLQKLCSEIPEAALMIDRWPEMIVAADVVRYPELQSDALVLMTKVVDNQHKKGLGDVWEGRATGLRDYCKTMLETKSYPVAAGSSPRGQWISSSIEWADAHARGPISRWHFRDHGVTHLAGYSHDYLYFQSPLRGSFTVEAEVATFGWRETRLMYNANWVGPQHTKSVVELGNLTRSWQSPKIEPPLDFVDWCTLKLVVEPNKATTFLNDRKVHEQSIHEHVDPWLALMSWGNCSGGARMVRITGKPEIPSELQLSSATDLNGWISNLYLDPTANEETVGWLKMSNEIVGRKFDLSPGRKRQSLLRYHRPLVEDSVVSYDFYYAPDQTLVHPAIGRMAMLLQPDGVKIHWLTDAQWERSGLAPDNMVSDPSCHRGPAELPLKNESWNHLQMKMTGDTVSLSLNDVEVFEGPIPLNNQRQLGLFHYADETEVRVQNVVYRGDWPKTLPSPKEQELSDAGPQDYDFSEGELATHFTWNFEGPLPKFLTPQGVDTPNRMEPSPGEARLIRGENAAADRTFCGFQWVADLKDDFEVTVKYRGFKSKTEETDWQAPRLEMQLTLGGAWGAPDNINIYQGGHRRSSDDRLHLFTGHGSRLPEKYDWKYTGRNTLESEGRLRFVRKGKTAYYLFARPDSDEWQLLNSAPVSEAPLKGGNFGIRAEKPSSSGELLITEFTVKTKTQKPSKP